MPAQSRQHQDRQQDNDGRNARHQAQAAPKPARLWSSGLIENGA
jgi:hypothetical protein